MKKLAVFLLACASVCWGQSMTSQKIQYANYGWKSPALESSFNHCLTSNEHQNCWFSIPGNATWINSSAGHTVAVDPSCKGYIYNDGRANNWTQHSEWGCVKEISYDTNGNLYGLVHNTQAGYWLSKWANSAWSDVSCCFASFRMAGPLMVAYDTGGQIWVSTNYGASIHSQPQCVPDGPAAIAPVGLDTNNNPFFYVACKSGKIWSFNGTAWNQFPGTATAIAIAPSSTSPYIIAANGNVQHWNGTGWDDIVTNTPVTSLSVGDPYNIWMIGPPAPDGAIIWRTWENGVILSHSFGGSVSCGQGVPQALCNTFTHQLHHQICYGSHCGPVAQSSWNGQGSWGPDAQVFATPYDLWTCLLADEPAGPCGLAENEASMECSGGGSSTDNPPTITAGVSWDNVEWTGFGGYSGPFLNWGNNMIGEWRGIVKQKVQDACWLTASRATCQMPSPIQESPFCEFDNTEDGVYCRAYVQGMMAYEIKGLSSPWTFIIPYTITNGVTSCIYPSSGIAYDGQYDWQAPCN